MVLHISQNRKIIEVQEDFNSLYRFLKIEFYKITPPVVSLTKRKQLLNHIPMEVAGLTKSANIELSDSMTVGQLENTLFTECGLSAQVSRKSGTLWLETTMTDNWTLKQQNDHGKELSEPLKNKNIPKDRSLDESDS